MSSIEILYTLSAIIAIGACIPQVVQLLRSKQSDSLNALTWATWMVTQLVALLYAASIGNLLMIGVAGLWVAFYASMTVMIVRYRHNPQPQPIVIASKLAE